MRFTISRKVFILFSTLSIFTAATALSVFIGLRQFSEARARLATISEFQLQVKNLQLFSQEVNLRHDSPEGLDIAENFTKIQELSLELDNLVKKAGVVNRSDIVRLSGQFEYFRKACLELIDRYRVDFSYPKVNKQLIDTLRQRLKVLPPPVINRINKNLDDFLLLQDRAYQRRDAKSISRMRKLAGEISQQTPVTVVAKSIKRILLRAEKNYFNHLDIENKEDFLDNYSAYFVRVADLAIEELRNTVDNYQRRLGLVIFMISGTLLLLILCFWLETNRYVRNFLSGLNISVKAIETGDFTYDLPEHNDDELGDQLLFIREMAASLEQSTVAIVESEKKYRSLVENVSNWIWIVDENGICTYSSPLIKVILGRDDLEVLGLSVKELLGRKVAGSATESLNSRLREAVPFSGVLHEVRRSDDRNVFLVTSGTPIFGENGVRRGFRLVSSDISKVRRAEQELRRSSQSRELINKILALALEQVDLQGILTRFADHIMGCSWLGLDSGVGIFLLDENKRTLSLTAQRGLSSNLIKTCSAIPVGTCLCGMAAQSGKVIFADRVDDRHEIVYEGMSMHGHYCVPIHSVAGKVIGVIVLYVPEGTVRDATVESVLVNVATILGSIISRRRAEDALFTLNKELENRVDSRTAQLTAANQELDSFAYSVSHDLRAPLRSIDGFSLALLEDYGDKFDAEGADYLFRVRSGCKRMDDLIGDMLTLSRLTRNEIQRQTIDITAMATEVLAELRQTDPGRGLEVVIAEGLQAEADPTMIRALLDNLLGNAWKYSSKNESARIEVGEREESGRPVFFIKDNGAGFDMQYADKLFTAFQRLHSEDQFEGTGIGLATVQRIINRHGGRIWAKAKEGEGATFYFIIG